MSMFSDLLDSGSGSTYHSPIGIPDLSYLDKTGKFNYLKDKGNFSSLLDPNANRGLLGNDPNQYISALPNAAKTFASVYQGPGYGKSDMALSDLVRRADAPSSVDQVRSELNNDQLDQTLAGIDQDTTNNAGSIKSDFLDRGLSGAGMFSDIEANALGQNLGAGTRAKAAARTTLGQSSLDLQKAREAAAMDAAKTRATTFAGQDEQANQIAAGGATTDVGTYANLLGQQANLQGQDLSRNQEAENLYYNLLNSSKNTYAGLTNTNLDLFAQLLNARDLGKAGQQTSMYNTGQQLEAGSYRPGLGNQILGNTSLSFGF